jgi:hypothetical protein
LKIILIDLKNKITINFDQVNRNDRYERIRKKDDENEEKEV